jgi:hypothetical protein
LRLPLGLLVVQNGEAPEPPNTGDINGYEFDGSTQFKFVTSPGRWLRCSAESAPDFRAAGV